eukprot:5771570-Amphidinium_carterae.1
MAGVEEATKRKTSIGNIGEKVAADMYAEQKAKLDSILRKQPELLPKILHLVVSGSLSKDAEGQKVHRLQQVRLAEERSHTACACFLLPALDD